MQEPVFEFEDYKEGIILTRFLEGPGELDIPSYISGKRVVAIGPECFRENGIMLTVIRVPETVRELQNDAFAYTVCLERLELPKDLEIIGADYLIASGLQEAFIPAGVDRIDRPELIDRSFKVSPDNKKYFTDGYGLYERDGDFVRLVAVNASETKKRYEIYAGTREIALNALRDAAAIEMLVIPESLTVIKEGTLSYNGGVVNENKGVKSVAVSPDNPVLQPVSDMLCRREQDGTLRVLRYFGGEKAAVPENTGVIGFESFKNTGIKELVIPDKSIQIKPGAFSGCLLERVLIGDTLVSFGDEDRFTREIFLEGFGKDGKIYDFTVLDDFLSDQYLTPGRIAMIAVRLKNPKDLSDEKKSGLRTKISDSLAEAIEMLSETRDVMTIESMGELGFFTKDNIDGLIDLMSRTDKKELTAWFMSYKNVHFKDTSGFDLKL